MKQGTLIPRGSATWGPPGTPESPWRLSLRRSLGEGERVAFIMLNPSTATGEEDDPTIRRCVGYAQRWGFGELVVVNLFSFRATDPEDLKKAVLAGVDIVGPGNDETILAAAESSEIVVAAWGVRGSFQCRDLAVVALLDKAGQAGRKLRALKRTAQGHPAHPLYQATDLLPQPWRP